MKMHNVVVAVVVVVNEKDVYASTTCEASTSGINSRVL
jgi:hypothetical protein